MGPASQWIGGLGLAVAGWLVTRLPARAFGFGRPAAVALDACAPMSSFLALVLITGRPLLSGVCVLIIFGAFAFADHAKRRILMEPVIFSDMSLLVLIVRHPALYLSYVGYGRTAAALALVVAAMAGLALIEPPVLPWSLVRALLTLTAVVGLIWAMANPWLELAAQRLRRFQPGLEAEADAAAFGALAMQLIHGIIARAERPKRWLAAHAPAYVPKAPRLARGRRPPIVAIQAESFFDARRMHPDMRQDLLPAFEHCRASSLQWGRLEVRGRGGNTMRTEFDVLTGFTSEMVGLDWPNPYHAFARRPVRSLAWTLKAAGYRTVCIHPFARTFFARHLVMPNLGFDEFWGEEAFDGRARDGGYISDAEVARVIELLLRQGDDLFLFAITVANHGPWPPVTESGLRELPPFARDAAGAKLCGFLKGLERSDAMLDRVAAAMAKREDPGLLAFFGDHLPSLPGAFERLAFTETCTDYLLWRNGEGQSARRDCAAWELPAAILGALG